MKERTPLKKTIKKKNRMIKSKIIFFIGIFACGFAYADATDYLDSQLAELTARRDKLKTELAECEQNTRGFKIAGISTLAATGVGVYANVALAKEIKKVETFGTGRARGGGGGAGSGGPGDDPCLTDAEGICDHERSCKDLVDPKEGADCNHGCGGRQCCKDHGCECWYEDKCKAEGLI